VIVKTVHVVSKAEQQILSNQSTEYVMLVTGRPESTVHDNSVLFIIV